MAFLKTAETLTLEGIEHLKKMQYMKALDRFTRAQKKKPRDVNIISYLSQAQLTVGEAEKAVETINEAISLDPGNVIHHQLKATYLMKQEKYEEAAPVIEKAIELRPGDVAFLMRGQVDFNLQRYDEAELWFDKALSYDPESPLSNQMKGLVLFHQQKFGEAIPYLEKALAVGNIETIKAILDECLTKTQ